MPCAASLAIGEIYVTARDNRGTQLRTIARALEPDEALTLAVEAPELVLSFYLKRPIRAVSDTTEFRGLGPPLYVIARNPPAQESFDPIAEGFVKGRRFVLWEKRGVPSPPPGAR